ncbi:hypothetical protein ACLOAU_21370 [Niabella sp. CJ426]|uniref:hypothetical protein n=1 Tax=Niabella sp. CJ426 TaxID=3393740 RepID=UPI003CFBEB0D
MKRKLKLAFDQLRKEMQPMNSTEMSSVLGGLTVNEILTYYTNLGFNFDSDSSGNYFAYGPAASTGNYVEDWGSGFQDSSGSSGAGSNPYYEANDDQMAINGGLLVETANGVQYYGSSGTVAFFPGVKLSKNAANNTAYQMNGTIHINENWANNGFDIDDFAHEYGHYLQQQGRGQFRYLLEIALPSVGSAVIGNILYKMFGTENFHDNQWYEKSATQLGQEFLIYNMWDPSKINDIVNPPSDYQDPNYSGFTSSWWA